MKLLIMLAGLLVATCASAQHKTADELAVEKQIGALINSWNRHDYSDMPQYATDDCDWVNIVGMWWKNRREVQYAHQVFHEKTFRNVSLTKKMVTTRVIAKDVILARVLKRIGAFVSPGGTHYPEADNLLMLVFVKKNGKWLLTAGQNVEVNEAAQKNNPVNKMPE